MPRLMISWDGRMDLLAMQAHVVSAKPFNATLFKACEACEAQKKVSITCRTQLLALKKVRRGKCEYKGSEM